MKALAAAILTFLLMVQSFSQWMIMAEYALNKDFIAKNLCINKARPKLHCNGKCQMMKKMAEEEKENSSNGNNTAKLKVQDLLFSHQWQALAIPAPDRAPRRYAVPKDATICSPTLASVFQPPAIA